MAPEIGFRLRALAKGAGLPLLLVPAIDHGISDALEHPERLIPFLDQVEVHSLALVIFYLALLRVAGLALDWIERIDSEITGQGLAYILLLSGDIQ